MAAAYAALTLALMGLAVRWRGVGVRGAGLRAASVGVLALTGPGLLAIRCNFPRLGMHGQDVLFFVTDHQGSTIATVDGRQTIYNRFLYRPFGDAVVAEGPRRPHFRYAGEERLEQSAGTYAVGARDYDPETGHFLQPDLLVPDAANPQAFNRYSYVFNDPVNRVDPSGLAPSSCEGAECPAPPPAEDIDVGIPAPSWPWNAGIRRGPNYPFWHSREEPRPQVASLNLNPTPGVQSGQCQVARQPIEIFGAPVPGVFPAPTRESEPSTFLGFEVPGTRVEGGLDIGPFENVGGTQGVTGPNGELLPIQTGAPDLLVPGGAAARGLKALTTTRVGRLLFGRGGVLNSNRFVRIGVGRRGGESVFRIAIGRTGRFKLDVVSFGQIPKVTP